MRSRNARCCDVLEEKQGSTGDGGDGQVSVVKAGRSEEVTWGKNMKNVGATGRGGTIPVSREGAPLPRKVKKQEIGGSWLRSASCQPLNAPGSLLFLGHYASYGLRE